MYAMHLNKHIVPVVQEMEDRNWAFKYSIFQTQNLF